MKIKVACLLFVLCLPGAADARVHHRKAVETEASAGRQAYKASCRQAGAIIGRDLSLKSGNQPILLVHGKPTQLAVVILHGFSASPYETMDLAAYLFQRGYNVFSVRLAGHGTTREEFDHTDWKQWLASAREGLDAAQGLGKRIVVVGHSMGGLLGCMLAGERPRQIIALVMAAPAFDFMDWRAPYSVLPPVRWLIPQTGFEPQDQAHVEYWQNEYSTREVAQLVELGWAARKPLAALHMPVFMLQAAGDPVISCQANQRLFARIPSHYKDLFIYPAKEHNVLTVNNPYQSEVFRRIDDFCLGIKASLGQ